MMINGKPHPFVDGLTLMGLLSELGLTDQPVVIELNQEALAPSEFSEKELQEDDQLEIITIAAGG